MADMIAGRELDALIHEKVMKERLFTVAEMQAEAEQVWREQPDVYWFFGGFDAWRGDDGSIVVRQRMPNYSTDIAAAWLVVEKMRGRDLFVDLYNWSYADGRKTTNCYIQRCEGLNVVLVSGVEAPTPSLAICLAALKALGGEQT